MIATVKVSSPLFDFNSTMNMTAWLDNATISGGSLLKYDLNELRRLPLATLLTNVLCAAMPVSYMQLLSPVGTFDSLGINMSSILASSLFNSTHVTFTTENHEMVSTVAQSIFSWVLTSAEELANGVIGAALPCNDGDNGSISPSEDQDSSSLLSLALVVTATTLLVVNGMFLFLRWRTRQSPR